MAKSGNLDEALAEADVVVAEMHELPQERQDSTVFYNAACVHAIAASQVDDPG